MPSNTATTSSKGSFDPPLHCYLLVMAWGKTVKGSTVNFSGNGRFSSVLSIWLIIGVSGYFPPCRWGANWQETLTLSPTQSTSPTPASGPCELWVQGLSISQDICLSKPRVRTLGNGIFHVFTEVMMTLSSPGRGVAEVVVETIS